MMKTSQAGIDLIKKFEGLELQAYQDIAGIWTIGHGHTGPDINEGMLITLPVANQILLKDLYSREQAINNMVIVELNQNQFDALVSFVFNVGVTAFRKSTALKRLNAGNFDGAAEALTWFNKATVNGVLKEVKGLTNRRAAEKALFLTPIEETTKTNNPAHKDYSENMDTRRNAGVEGRIIPGRGWLGKLFRMVRNIALNSGKHGERK